MNGITLGQRVWLRDPEGQPRSGIVWAAGPKSGTWWLTMEDTHKSEQHGTRSLFATMRTLEQDAEERGRK